MKIPNVMTVRQSVTLAIASAVIAVFIAIFGPVVVFLLAAIAFVAACYAAILKWLPEFVAEAKEEKKG